MRPRLDRYMVGFGFLTSAKILGVVYMQTMCEINVNGQVAVQDQFLSILSKEKVPAYIYLKNGIKLQGFVEAFDQEVIILKNQESQLIYKSSIATIMPAFGIKDVKRQHQKASPEHID